ncbi:MAG: SAV_6107 family HEPN domain-containing protein [Brachybacterium sp.]|nr:SAV_6107 family HEPN domain-containing protein [Brachybacterium sp.]
MSAPTISPAGREHARRLRHADEDLARLEQAEALLADAREQRDSDPRRAFEAAHRAALRAAGVVVAGANRSRVRPLPLNVWTALGRIGPEHRAWVEEAAPMVAERDRLLRSDAAHPDPALLDAHLRATGERISAVRSRLLMDLLDGGALPAAR